MNLFILFLFCGLQFISNLPQIIGFDHGILKVMTYNVQNFDSGGDWNMRKRLILEVIYDASPDIVALQEVRTRGGRDQANELSAGLSQYHYVRDTSMGYEDGSTEGLAVFSKTPILSHNVCNLGSSIEDINERIVQHVVVQLPGNPDVLVDVFHTHLSYDRFTQTESMGRLLECVEAEERNGRLQVLLGDLNIHPDHQYVSKVLTGLLPAPPPFAKSWEPFTDLWAAVHPAASPEEGFTFSTSDPVTRCDFVLARGHFKPTSIDILGGIQDIFSNSRTTHLAPSDHFAVLASLNLDKDVVVDINIKSEL
mmetsp:Transcript_14242/g.19638  ORF Transcript_14242/g.19638 Transcript_14242/m.19638 type:complete len:309 (-) Transcript_14242:80-1006(-)